MQALGQYIQKFLPQTSRANQTMIGVHLTPGHAWVVAARRNAAGNLKVEHIASDKLGRDGWSETLHNLYQKVAPRGAVVSVALSPAFYSLLLVDAPAVDSGELREAVKWRIKDLVNIPLDALVVDAFALPPDAYRGRLNMIYVAATDRNLVMKIGGAARDKWPLAGISIQELAMVKTGALESRFQQGGTAFLQVDESGSAIYLAEGGQLYLSRTLDMASRDSYSGSQDNEQKAERLALDVQRSLDYYESQIGKPAPARLAWVQGASMTSALAEGLGTRLSVNITPLALESLAVWKELPDASEHLHWATALGAVLLGADGDATH